MAGVNKFGKIFLCIKGTGSMIKPMVEEGWFIQMEMYIKVNGVTIRLMEKVFIYTKMEHLILVNGSKIFNKDMVYRSG
jgi:hypothetical protein